MPDLLTPAELAAIIKTALKKSGMWLVDPDYSVSGWEENTTQLEDALKAIRTHIAALEARTPAPTLPADMETLLADAGYKAVLAALRQEAVDKCAGGFGAPDLDADYQLSLSLLVREVYQILNIEQHIDALATALRESRAREVAEPYRHALEQRLICSNLPLLTGDADADLMRFVFHEQELALSPEAGVIAELKEQRDTALSWTATYTNMDVYRRCLATAIARAEKAEAERDRLAQYHGGHRPDCGGMDELEGRCDCGYLQGEAYRELITDLAAARAELGALGKKAAEAVEVAYKSGITDTSSMPGPKIIEQMWQDSTARRAALAIRVVKEAQ